MTPDPRGAPEAAEVIVHNGRIATQDGGRSFASAAAIRDGRFVAVGDDRDVLALRGEATRVIGAGGRTVIPGLNDSHIHLIRGGLTYNLELRWEGVTSLADGLRLLREQARRTPPPHWVRVVGGWSEFQFAERRMPTLDEINAVAPDTPVFVLHLYDRALLNAAALRACGYTRDTPDPPGGEFQRDKAGRPTGLLIARPNALILYATLAKAPKPPPEHAANSTRQFMRELNRLGVTSVIDAGGGFQNYPDDYRVVDELHRRGELTVRIAYNLFTQRPGRELDDFARWAAMTRPGAGSDFYHLNGAGEMLVFSAADFEDFREHRPELAPSMEGELTRVVRLLVENRWPFRVHATYDESIRRFLDVFEAVHREVPFDGLRWFFDHAETVTPPSLERIRALGGGVAIQHRMAYQGEYFLDRYGRSAAAEAPPVARMLRLGLPVGAGTDATRVAGYNPWVALSWLVTGRTVGGTALYGDENRLDRMEALRRYTVGSAWFSGDEGRKGAIIPGQLADLAVLSADYFSVPDDAIRGIESVLTLVGGRIVHASAEFAPLAPPPLPVLPEWSPLRAASGAAPLGEACSGTLTSGRRAGPPQFARTARPVAPWNPWGPGCSCYAF